LTVAVLWIQAILLFSYLFETTNISWSLKPIGPFAFVIMSLTVIWLLLLKPSLQQHKAAMDMNSKLLRFKNNPRVFEALLNLNPAIDGQPWPDDLQIGDPNSTIQIVVACNPYCSPCANAHKFLHQLAENRQIGLTIRFGIIVERYDKKIQAVQYLLRLLDKKPPSFRRKALHDWYLTMDMELFRKNYPLNEELNVTELVLKHEQWTKANFIKYTPTIYVNGHLLPSIYKAEDLPALINSTLLSATSASTQLEEVLQEA
jgi:hypothetical protein